MEKSAVFIYYPCYSKDSCEPKSPKILRGLGKATKRGVKKCYKCGVYNGTRGIACKNKLCDAVFKDSEKKKASFDSVKLITSNFRQVFSVRVRDTGPDHRGFVQLPVLLPGTEEDVNLFSEVALCFVDSCQRLFDDSILQCHENEVRKSSPLCVHIKSALQSKNLANPLEIKKEVLSVLKIGTDVKDKLWTLACNKEDPLVQKISKNVMAIKCQVTPEHPLGYLHFRLLSRKGKDICDSYHCTCAESVENLQDISYIRDKDLACRQNSRETTVVQLYLHESRKVKLSSEGTFKKNKAKLKKLVPKTFPLYIEIMDDKGENNIHKNFNKGMCFIDWLSSTTEVLNETIKLENCSILNSLIFDVPKVYCESLFQRIPEELFGCKYDLSCENVIFLNKSDMLEQIFNTSKIKLLSCKTLIQDDLSSENAMVKYGIHFDLNANHKDQEKSFVIHWVPNRAVLNLGQLKFQYKLIIKPS